jgi:branched-chain amino acid transport system substrate-binding protein
MKLRVRALSITIVLALLALATTAVTGPVAGAGSDETVRIGLEAPLTGDQATIGKGMLRGARLAARQLNADGGIDGKMVEIVAIDDAADPVAGVKAATGAIADGLDGVVGPYNSGVGAETLPLYLDAGLVPIRLTSADETAGMGFTLQPMTSQIAPVAADALTTWLEAESVAIIYDPTTLYTETVSTALRSRLEAAGVTIAAFEPIEPGEDDYTDVVEKVEATSPSVVYVATYFPEGGLIAKAMHELPSKAECLADYGAYDTGYITTAGVAAARSCPIVGVPSPNEFPGARRSVAAYRKAFRAAPGTWSPYTFDSVKLFAQSAEEAGGFDAAALTAVLNQVDGYEGWTASVTLRAGTGNREPATVVVLDVRGKGTFRIDAKWASAVGYEGA